MKEFVERNITATIAVTEAFRESVRKQIVRFEDKPLTEEEIRYIRKLAYDCGV